MSTLLCHMADLSHLTKLRCSRGSDDSLKVCGDRDFVRSVLENIATYSREDLTAAILGCYDGDLFGSTMWTRKYSAWGNAPERITVHGHFAERYPHLAQLNLDMGFLSYLPEFLKCAKKEGMEDDSPIVVRKKFKEHLGTTTLWRGIKLTKDELNTAENEGIYSSFFRMDDSHPLLEQFEANVLSVYPWKLLDNQFYGGNYFSPLISVSADKDVAEKVGGSYSSSCRKTGEAKDLYLFELKIPLIDVVAYTDHCLKVPDKLKSMVEYESETLTSNNKSTNHPLWKTNIEQFILYKVDVNEVVRIIKS